MFWLLVIFKPEYKIQTKLPGDIADWKSSNNF